MSEKQTMRIRLVNRNRKRPSASMPMMSQFMQNISTLQKGIVPRPARKGGCGCNKAKSHSTLPLESSPEQVENIVTPPEPDPTA